MLDVTQLPEADGWHDEEKSTLKSRSRMFVKAFATG